MLVDSFDRSFVYLRLSVTEKCNFRCSYCLPFGYQPCGSQHFLDLLEIKNLALAFADLGITKIRITGGEPTLRGDISEIIQEIKRIDKIKTVALTTNGFRLPKLLPQLRDSGLDALNISLDTLDPAVFKKICGLDYCESIKRAIDQSLELGIGKVKINAVLLKGINDCQLPEFLNWISNRPVSVRFIELMRTNDNADYFKKHHLPVSLFQSVLLQNGWSKIDRAISDGPAIEYTHQKYKGKVGFIAPYSERFCVSCNRLRVSAVGGLRLCLFGQGNFDLRPLLREESQQEELKETICRILNLKPQAHRLHEELSGNMASLSAIGG